MELDRDFARRLGIGLTALSLFLVIGYMLVSFVAVVVFAVFLYYAVRPIFRFLDRFALPRRLRAALSLVVFGIPFLVLLAYTVAIIALEVQLFLDRHGLLEDVTGQLFEELNIAGLDAGELETLVTNADALPPLDTVADSLLGAASAVGSGLVQLLIIVVAVYYMLVDGPRFLAWLLDTYDESGIFREYARAVDPEVSKAMFGNIVNVFVTAFVGIFTFYTFNLLVPSTVQIPFPVLAGALAGIGSLIPVIGIKLVYVPITIGLAANAWLAGEPGLLLPVAVLFVVSAVIVDFIPDFFIRAHVSDENTHTGLLMLSYIVGPTVFGFYGLFLAPMVLIAASNALTILLPYALAGDPTATKQTSLTEFDDD